MKKIFLFLILSIIINSIYAQVGINTENPNSLTELDIQNLVQNSDTIPKGIMIPRMTQKQRDDIIISDSGKANSLLIYNITENCYNYYSASEKKWKSLCGSLSKATFTFNCSNVSVLGNYTEGTALGADNKLKINITVSEPGIYQITGSTTNGYYFTAEGTFPTAGNFDIYATGVGTPAVAQTDAVTLSQNGESSTCNSVNITVASPIATYALNCSNTVVNGSYIKGTALDPASNTISIDVNVSKLGSYNILTPVINGISFSASGSFTSTGIQTVTLAGVGTPSVNHDFIIDITSNSISSSNSCSAEILVTLPKMTYAIIGGNDQYTWQATARQLALTSDATFGSAGVYRTDGLSQLWVTANASTAVTNLESNTPPDIILFFSYGSTINSSLATAIANYINKGGVVIYGTKDNDTSGANQLLTAIFGSDYATAQRMTSNRNSYQITINATDPILNGPFGNISGRYWSEDNSGSLLCTAIPNNAVQLVSANNNDTNNGISPSSSLVWYSDSKNFVYFGDCVYATYPGGSYYNTTNGTGCAVFTSTGLPDNKLNAYSNAQSVFMYNSYLELNAVAWALEKASSFGINPH